MTAVRPPVWPSVQPASTGGAGNAGNARTAAQRAFFDQALGKAGAPQAATPQPVARQTPAVRTETVPQPAAQPVRDTSFTASGDQPRKILRPGSLLDIKV